MKKILLVVGMIAIVLLSFSRNGKANEMTGALTNFSARPGQDCCNELNNYGNGHFQNMLAGALHRTACPNAAYVVPSSVHLCGYCTTTPTPGGYNCVVPICGDCRDK